MLKYALNPLLFLKYPIFIELILKYDIIIMFMLYTLEFDEDDFT